MIGIISAIKMENRNGVLNCILKFETILSIDEYNEIVKAFGENVRFEEGSYKMERKGRYIKFERTDK